MGTGERPGKNLAQEKLKIEGWLARWLIAFGFRFLQLWARTLRFEIEDRAGIVGRPVTENYIGALWHNRLLIFPLILRRFFPNRHGAALISASSDGDLLADGVCGLSIARKLRVSQPTASEHLKILVQAELLRGKRIKQWTFYKRDEMRIGKLKRMISRGI